MLYRIPLALLILTSTLFGPLLPAHATRGEPPKPVAALPAAPSVAPDTTPTIDGAIMPGEYGTHVNGGNQQTSGGTTWYMTWDATNLYVGIAAANIAEGAVFYLDTNPLPTFNGGANTNGNLSGQTYDGTNLAHLPFRADVVVYFHNTYREYRTANGAGGWGSANTGFGAYADNGGTNVRELAIPWADLGGMTMQFAWLGYVTSSGGFAYGQVPTGNASGNIGTTAVYNNFYSVNNTGPGGSPPFYRQGYAQNFDTLANSGTTSTTTPANWYFFEAGTNANISYTVGNGNANGGDTYSLGNTSVAERAFGGLRSGSLTPTVGFNWVNNTGGPVSDLQVAYMGEQWRLGVVTTTARTERLDFQYSTDAISLTTGTWTNVDALDFTSPITAGAPGAVSGRLDGNMPTATVMLTGMLSGLFIPNGASVWVRWNDFDAFSSDDALGVDSFSVVAIPQGPTANLSIAKSGPTTVNAGTLFTYNLTINNTGPSTATATVVTDILPSEVMFVTYTTGLPAVFSQPSANVLRWELGGMPPGSSGMIDIQAMSYASVTNGTLITNTALIASTIPDTATTNNTSAWPLTVYGPALSITKTVVPAAAVPYHGVVTYTVTLNNMGGADAAGVTVSDMLPAGTAFGGWVQQPAGTVQNGNAITWTGTASATSNLTLVFTATHTGNFDDVITNTAQFNYSLGSGMASAAFSVVSAGADLRLNKDVWPSVGVPLNSLVTYTIALENIGLGDALGVMLTDVLPISTTFAYWVEQPLGANISSNTLTWTGNISTNTQLTFTFAVTQNYPYGAQVVNTAEFEHTSGSGADTATFMVEPLYAVTFVYNDAEDVVLPGEMVNLAGSFNGWTTGVWTLTANVSNTVFSYTTQLPAGAYQYKYVVQPGENWDWLNTNDRTVNVTTNTVVQDYRHVVVGWANLNGPATQTVLISTTTTPISGQVYIQNVTDPAGPGRGVRAQVGYGNSANPALWAWSPTVFDSQMGNNDAWRGPLTPTVTGVFSYAMRYDGNWGAGNPNASWAYGDRDGSPFSVAQAGVLTVTTLRIRDIQGTTHYSPYSGTVVASVPGIVTAKHTNGFYVQDPNPDADPRTSEAIFFFNSTAPAVNVGDYVVFTGTVVEFINSTRPNDLPLTEISNPGRAFRVVSSTNPLPAPILLGNGGLAFITQTIADARGTIGVGSAISNPTLYGVDFYEALEGMRIQVNNAVVVGPTSNFSESVVLADNGANATGPRNARGGILYTYADPNPERLMIDDEVFKGLGGMVMPLMHVSATIPGPMVGVLDYQFSNYRMQVSQLFTATTSPITLEATSLAPTSPSQVLVAGFNVENLAGTDPQSKFDTLADFVVNRLNKPDILSLQEIQDNNGVISDGTVIATVTISRLVAAITAAGGPTYEYREVAPANLQDGGAPGGNIRVGFIFRPDRVTFVDRPGSLATTTVTATVGVSGVELSYSPGRIDPNNIYFADSRKPLVGEFLFNGQKLFVIGNHFNSKTADQPLWGRFQPPFRSTEISRTQQALAVNAFVSHLRTLDPNVNVVVLGDINDFEFSPVMNALKGDDLTNLFDLLPANERYSYVFEGNSQSLDHILVSNNLAATAVYDPVHASAEFAAGVQVSDHDPDVVLLTLASPNFSTSSKTVNTTTVAAGQRLTYTLTVNNSGNAAATFMLTDTLDANLSIISAGGMTVNGQTLTASGTLTASAQQTYVIVVQVSNTFSGLLANTATLAGDGQTRPLTAPIVTVAARWILYLPRISK